MTARTLRLIALMLSAISVSCRAQHSAPPPEYAAFQHPERVTIANYSGDAMEPFLTHDGRYLLFNNRNDPSVNPTCIMPSVSTTCTLPIAERFKA